MSLLTSRSSCTWRHIHAYTHTHTHTHTPVHTWMQVRMWNQCLHASMLSACASCFFDTLLTQTQVTDIRFFRQMLVTWHWSLERTPENLTVVVCKEKHCSSWSQAISFWGSLLPDTGQYFLWQAVGTQPVSSQWTAKAWSATKVKSHLFLSLTVSLPKLVDFDWRVDVKTASDTVARMSVPTCILSLQVNSCMHTYSPHVHTHSLAVFCWKKINCLETWNTESGQTSPPSDYAHFKPDHLHSGCDLCGVEINPSTHSHDGYDLCASEVWINLSTHMMAMICTQVELE